MQPLSHENLGIAIAYVLPGFFFLCGISMFSPAVQSWMSVSAGTGPSVGGFLYVVLSSLALGIFANMLRSIVIDPIQNATGIEKKHWRFSQLQPNIEAVQFVVLHQFRYYQFAGNMALALLFSFSAMEIAARKIDLPSVVAFVFLQMVLWVGGRKNLRTYYQHLEDVLGMPEAKS